jgi:DNA-binding NarL/FixJ family response regulator
MKKILIIDDDSVMREITAKFIHAKNFEVFVAKDGLEGVQQTLQYLPDLILCDISMPNMNGLEFYKTIKQIKATSAIPLVFLSSNKEHEDVRAGMALGADDYIIKPFDFYELLKVIKIRLAKYERIEQFSDEKFHAAIKHPTLGMFIYQNGHFLYYNETLASIFGYTNKAFSTITFKELIEEDKSTKIKVLNDINQSLKDINSSISLKFDANHTITGKIKVELFGTVITYRDVPSIVGNMIGLNYNQDFKRINTTGSIDFKLNNRELEVLELICEGKSTHQMSELLFLSQRTIETYRANLLSKTNSKNSAALLICAIKNKLIILKD